MAHSDRILKALESAIKQLDNSISALKDKDENKFSNSVWHTAAELEYALFLLSLTIGNEYNISVKLNPEPKSLSTDQIMLKVRELISEAHKSVRNGDFMNACRITRLARRYIFEVQNSLTGKKHGTRKGRE